jgi:2-isopropylmalate synthase
VQAVTEGTDAQANVSVRLSANGRSTSGRAADADTLVASARAYVAALNRLLTLEERRGKSDAAA